MKTELLHPIIAPSLCLHSSFLPRSRRPADSLDMVTKVTCVQRSVSIHTKIVKVFVQNDACTDRLRNPRTGVWFNCRNVSAPTAMISLRGTRGNLFLPPCRPSLAASTLLHPLSAPLGGRMWLQQLLFVSQTAHVLIQLSCPEERED